MEDNVVLMDFFCHGIPSMLLWKKYLRNVEKITGIVIYASWRNKNKGWHDSFNILIKGKQTSFNSWFSQGDLFYKMFLSDICLGKACYEKCKYKALASSADIRIGDLWGKAYQHDDKGVSGVLVFTNKGQKTIDSLKDKVTFVGIDDEVVIEGQMKDKTKSPKFYNIIIYMLSISIKLSIISLTATAIKKTDCCFKLIGNLQKMIAKIRHRM
jgi:hypothetical protein